MARTRRPKEASGRDETTRGSDRVSVSGDVDISTYLGIARERERSRPAGGIALWESIEAGHDITWVQLIDYIPGP